MRRFIWAGLGALSLGLGGCATLEPMTLEETLARTHSTSMLHGSEEEELRYRVGFQYANRARLADDSLWSVRDPDTMNSATYDFLTAGSATANFLSGASGAGVLDLVTWFGDGLSKEAGYSAHLQFTTGYVSTPNTQYYRFDDTPGEATAEDVYKAWEAADGLRKAVYRGCEVAGWKPDIQYRHARVKDAPGSYKEIAYYCEHPVMPSERVLVVVNAFANPAPGVRTVGMVQSNCWMNRMEKDWVDITGCGAAMANRHYDAMPGDDGGEWLQLFTTPTAEDPGKMVTVARYQGMELMMKPPPMNERYADFLRGKYGNAKTATEASSY